jgi:hypothetical protein
MMPKQTLAERLLAWEKAQADPIPLRIRRKFVNLALFGLELSNEIRSTIRDLIGPRGK